MFDALTIENGITKVGVNPQGGYVTSWDDILYQGSVIKRTGIPILFPYYGKARTTRMHGFGRDSLWRVIHHEPTSLTLELTDSDIDDAARHEYPHTFIVRLNITLGVDISFIYRLTVHNTGSSPLPISPGIHPYWALPHEQKTQIEIDGVTGFSANSIDWDTTPPDLPLEFSGQATVHLIKHSVQITELSDPLVVKYLQLWSQTPLRDPDFNFVCVEPICGLNYGIDDQPIVINPTAQWEMALEFKN